MKFFCIGLSKTGTTSIIEAFRLLGYRGFHALHGGSHYYNQHLTNIFHRRLPQALLSQFDAFGDIPFSEIYEELYRAYPGARFIRTVRNEEDWLKSCRNHFGPMGREMQHNAGLITCIRTPALVRLFTYGSCDFNEELFRRKYRDHTKEVRQFFADKQDQYLELDICAGDDWDQLCPFIGRNYPNIPFPHKNKGDYNK